MKQACSSYRPKHLSNHLRQAVAYLLLLCFINSFFYPVRHTLYAPLSAGIAAIGNDEMNSLAESLLESCSDTCMPNRVDENSSGAAEEETVETEKDTEFLPSFLFAISFYESAFLTDNHLPDDDRPSDLFQTSVNPPPELS